MEIFDGIGTTIFTFIFIVAPFCFLFEWVENFFKQEARLRKLARADQGGYYSFALEIQEELERERRFYRRIWLVKAPFIYLQRAIMTQRRKQLAKLWNE